MDNKDDSTSIQPGPGAKKAPGAPGMRPTWSPAPKAGVGCAMTAMSRLWFTVGRGIVNEVYHPWIDHAAIRDLGLIVTGPDDFFSEEQKHCKYDIQMIEPGVPAYRLENHCLHGRYRIVKEIIADPHRDVLLQRIRFVPLQGSLSDFRLYVLMSPRLGDQGKDNSGWVGSYRSRQMLFADREGHSLALASSVGWLRRSVGFVGTSDAWQDLHEHGRMTWEYERADCGHIALAGEIDLKQCGGEFVLALAFDRTPQSAAVNASMSLHLPFAEARDDYIKQWKDWQSTVGPLDDSKSVDLANDNAEQRNRPDRSRPRVNKIAGSNANLYRTSMMTLAVHRSKQFMGASVASLSVPWGEARGDEDLGGYHLVWPRDLVEETSGLLAGGAFSEAFAVLNYLRATQKTSGGWPQDMWLDGCAYGKGEQLDEAALPILLLNLAHREGAVQDGQVESFWPMVRDAASFIIRSGPATGEDRWENTPGLSPYTLATEISALLVAARLADQFGEERLGQYFRETADLWNDLIEPWTYVTDTPLARRLGIEGYYVRIAPAPGMRSILRRGEWPCMKQAKGLPTAEVVSPDALALVRFGLRAPDDPRILNTIKVIDAMTRTELPAGPCWRRYNGDYYGEHDDGTLTQSHGDHSGTGRSWPLLTGERGHYELAAGNTEAAKKMLDAMAGFASEVGLLPEQVWDIDDVPEHDLYRGRASSSAMPLAWTHSEFIRLLRSIRDGKVFDCPEDAWERYVNNHSSTDLSLWRFDHQVDFFPAGRRVRLELTARAIVRFSLDRWATTREQPTKDTGAGLHIIDLPTAGMKPGDELTFTFRWTTDGDRWEGKDFRLTVDEPIPAKPATPSSTRPRTQTQTQHQRSTKDDHSTAGSSQAQRARPVRATSKN